MSIFLFVEQKTRSPPAIKPLCFSKLVDLFIFQLTLFFSNNFEMISSNDPPSHLVIRPLTKHDLEKVNALEAQCFPPNEAASKDSIKYRLSICPELSSALFIRSFSQKKQENFYIPERESTIVDEQLIGHIMSTKIKGSSISEASMMVADPNIPDSGHIESGHVIALHSLAIHPDYRGMQLASLLIKDFIQKLRNQQVGSKITILAHEDLIPFYEKLDFENKGVSNCKHGGDHSVWYDMDYVLKPVEDEY